MHHGVCTVIQLHVMLEVRSNKTHWIFFFNEIELDNI